MRLTSVVLVATACGGTHRDPSVDPPAPSTAFQIPKSGSFKLPATFTACTKDDDCTIVALGCCDNTPVNLAHSDVIRDQLEKSRRPFCSPKTACGPSGNGTWEGMSGVCDANTCAMPSTKLQIPSTGAFTLPADYTRCTQDTDCIVVSLGCADETAVNRVHEIETRRALKASGRAYRPPKDACGPGPGATMDGVAGKCTAGACTIPKWP